ncbi:MAG: hypothetical protein ACTSVV_03675 [Promethearchaeota archaeon]
MGNIHKEGKHFFETTRLKIKSSIILGKELNNSNNALIKVVKEIGKIDLIYNEQDKNKNKLSPDMELIIELNFEKILNFLGTQEKIYDPFSDFKNFKTMRHLKNKISCIVELERGGISAAKHDLNQYNLRNDEDLMIELPIINIITNDKILDFDLSKKEEEMVIEKNIKLKSYETSKFINYT